MFRRSPRAAALWAGATVVALLTAGVVASDLAAIHRRAGDLGPVVDAVVATRDLPLGTTIAVSGVGERPVHRSQHPRGTLEGRARATDRVVAVPVVRGGYVTAANLTPVRRTGLDGSVPAGMRAMRVVVTNALAVRPGAAVDVLATFDGTDAASTNTDDATSATVVVAAGVQVLGTDGASEKNGSRGDTLGVTLLVDADDSRRLAFAEANGVVTIALVPPEDAAHR
jgi:Flp pilus assembly protein CpaB